MNAHRLLVVEDDAALCESIADVLRFTGYEVRTASDAESALTVLGEPPPPDAILLDMVLPGTSAAGLVARLRARGTTAPVVLMTGMSPRAVEAGTDDLLLKPFDVDELLSHVARACAAPPRGGPPPRVH